MIDRFSWVLFRINKYSKRLYTQSLTGELYFWRHNVRQKQFSAHLSLIVTQTKIGHLEEDIILTVKRRKSNEIWLPWQQHLPLKYGDAMLQMMWAQRLSCVCVLLQLLANSFNVAPHSLDFSSPSPAASFVFKVTTPKTDRQVRKMENL